MVEGLVSIRPALILPPSSILSLEGGLWTKHHFLSVDIGGTGDCLEFLGLYDCSDGHSSQNLRVVLRCGGRTLLVSLFASDMSLVSFDR